MANKKYSDQEILDIIKEFESLNDDQKLARKIGSGSDALVYDVPDKDMVLKVPNHENAYNLDSLSNTYLYSKQLGKVSPVEQPILVKRPNSNDVLLQNKANIIERQDVPTDEFYNNAFNHPKDIREKLLLNEKNRLKNLPENKEYYNYLKDLDSKGIVEGDIHDKNLSFDPDTKKYSNIDVGKFYYSDEADPSGIKNQALHKARESFSDAMDKITKTRIYRSIPILGTAMGVGAALHSGDASAAIPFLDQADSLGPEKGSLDSIIENPSLSYEARKQALEKIRGK